MNVLRARCAAISWFVFAVLFVVLTVLSIARSANADVTYNRPYAAQRDATDVIWAPAKALLANANPYDVEAIRAAAPESRQDFVGYLPHHVTIHVAFGLVPRAPALFLFAAFSALCLILTVVVGVRSTGRCRTSEARSIGIICALTLLSAPGALTIWLGQTSFEVALGAMLLSTKRRSLQIAGALLVTQKPHIGVVILGAWTLSGRISIRRVFAAAGFAALLTLPVVRGRTRPSSTGRNLGQRTAESHRRTWRRPVEIDHQNRHLGSRCTAHRFLGSHVYSTWFSRTRHDGACRHASPNIRRSSRDRCDDGRRGRGRGCSSVFARRHDSVDRNVGRSIEDLAWSTSLAGRTCGARSTCIACCT